MFPVECVARGQVAARHALHREHGRTADQHGAALKLVAEGMQLGGEVVDLRRDNVVRYQIAEQVEPEQRNLGQNLALAGDARAEHVVKGGDAVGGHHQQVVAHCIQIADLAAADERHNIVQIGFKQSSHARVLAFRKGIESRLSSGGRGLSIAALGMACAERETLDRGERKQELGWPDGIMKTRMNKELFRWPRGCDDDHRTEAAHRRNSKLSTWFGRRESVVFEPGDTRQQWKGEAAASFVCAGITSSRVLPTSSADYWSPFSSFSCHIALQAPPKRRVPSEAIFCVRLLLATQAPLDHQSSHPASSKLLPERSKPRCLRLAESKDLRLFFGEL
jgi:hypothetical protein